MFSRSMSQRKPKDDIPQIKVVPGSIYLLWADLLTFYAMFHVTSVYEVSS